MASCIHPTALVDDVALLGDGCLVGPGVVIEKGVEVGANCCLEAHAVLQAGTRLESGVKVGIGAVIGGLPQDLRFRPEVRSGVWVGADTVVREHVTINRATAEGGWTRVGARCFLMAGSHVAHDCVLGEGVVLANNVMLAGHVKVGDHSFLGGGAAVHQHGRIGRGVMVSGLTRLSRDAPPFVMVAERDWVCGLNLVGLRRRGYPEAMRRQLKEAYHAVYQSSGNNPFRAARELLVEPERWVPEVREFLQFFGDSRRGVVRPRRRGAESSEDGAMQS